MIDKCSIDVIKNAIEMMGLKHVFEDNFKE